MRTTTIGALAAAVLLCGGCHHVRSTGDADPILLRLTLNAPPRMVVRTAAERLNTSGFLVTAIDSVTGLRAEREQRPGELDETMSCQEVVNPAVLRSLVPTMIVDLSARPLPGGRTELSIAARVRAMYMRLTAEPARPANYSDCRSSGELERQLSELLTQPGR